MVEASVVRPHGVAYRKTSRTARCVRTKWVRSRRSYALPLSNSEAQVNRIIKDVSVRRNALFVFCPLFFVSFFSREKKEKISSSKGDPRHVRLQ